MRAYNRPALAASKSGLGFRQERGNLLSARFKSFPGEWREVVSDA
jgi:hypothetical protein